MRLVKLLLDGWPTQHDVAQVVNPEESNEWGKSFSKICSSPKGDILLTKSDESKYVVIWSISREEIKAVDKLKLCDEGVSVRDIYCSTK